MYMTLYIIEIQECNRHKIVNEMLNQARVVSAAHPFPIWCNNQPIHLRMCNSLLYQLM